MSVFTELLQLLAIPAVGVALAVGAGVLAERFVGGRGDGR